MISDLVKALWVVGGLVLMMMMVVLWWGGRWTNLQIERLLTVPQLRKGESLS